MNMDAIGRLDVKLDAKLDAIGREIGRARPSSAGHELEDGAGVVVQPAHQPWVDLFGAASAR